MCWFGDNYKNVLFCTNAVISNLVYKFMVICYSDAMHQDVVLIKLHEYQSYFYVFTA